MIEKISSLIGFIFGCYIAKISQNSEIIKVGVCFHNSIYEYLPYDDHDIKLDYIITDQILIRL